MLRDLLKRAFAIKAKSMTDFVQIVNSRCCPLVTAFIKSESPRKSMRREEMWLYLKIIGSPLQGREINYQRKLDTIISAPHNQISGECARKAYLTACIEAAKLLSRMAVDIPETKVTLFVKGKALDWQGKNQILFHLNMGSNNCELGEVN